MTQKEQKKWKTNNIFNFMKRLLLLTFLFGLISNVEANGDWMATHRVDLSTMEESSWTASLTKDSCCE